MAIQANVTNNQITANVGETQIDVSVGGGEPQVGVSVGGGFGPSGTSATVAVGTVTTGAPGSSASVVNAGSSSAAVLNFTIPAGAQGPAGATGAQGPAGSNASATTDASALVTGTLPAARIPATAVTAGSYGSPNQVAIISVGTDGRITGASNYQISILASQVVGSTLDIGRIPTGTTSSTVSLGNHGHGNISTGGAIGITSGQIVVTTTGGVLTTAASISNTQVSGLGTLATQSGTFSGSSSGTNTGDQTITLTGDVTGSGTGSFAATLSNTGVSAGTFTSVTVDAKGRVTAGSSPAVAYSSLTGTPSTFAPSAHKSTHATGGSDALTAADVGAAAVSHTHSASDITSGTVATARLGSGTASSGNFLRGDGTWAAAGSTSASDLSSGTLPEARLPNSVILHPFLLAGM